MLSIFKVNAQFLGSKHNEYTFKDKTFSGETYSFLVTENLPKPLIVTKFINSVIDKADLLQMQKDLKVLKPMQNVVLVVSHSLYDGKLQETVKQVILP